MPKRFQQLWWRENQWDFSKFPVQGKIPQELLPYEEAGEQPKYGISVSESMEKKSYEHTLFLIPSVVTVGIGCRKGTPADKIERAVDTVLEELHMPIEALEQVSSIDVKKEEEGLLQFCREHKLPFLTYSAAQLAAVEGTFTESEFVKNLKLSTFIDSIPDQFRQYFSE